MRMQYYLIYNFSVDNQYIQLDRQKYDVSLQNIFMK